MRLFESNARSRSRGSRVSAHESAITAEWIFQRALIDGDDRHANGCEEQRRWEEQEDAAEATHEHRSLTLDEHRDAAGEGGKRRE